VCSDANGSSYLAVVYETGVDCFHRHWNAVVYETGVCSDANGSSYSAVGQQEDCRVHR